ncbi:Gim4 protein [Candida orthopsilosis Co 90-125]|uniref:Gim4 protein n=1 Tax=Candida orthopsilosis (strain 90-125) TaxID=1136231 RepID=H8WYB7_CANO9|nr:Gim4 protein [Candida orthopsilosis Co 90-125]CCG21232.1 Gim4 protein [Candida orthopsilosis Co 90-125]
MSSTSTAADEKKSQILQQEYNRYQELIQELETQSSTLASQLQEHIIVDRSLTAIAPEKRQGRKCFKMIGGVLVEKSIDEVIKILADEVKELTKQKETVDEELKNNRTTLEKWISLNKIKVVKG